MLYERKFILRRILFATLRVWWIHHTDSCTFKLHLCWILFQKIFAFDVTVAIFPENHIGSSNSKHIALEFKAVQLLLLDILTLVLISTCLFEHMVHGCNKETGSAAAGIP